MNENVIWSFLMAQIKNPYGVAGLMGNLYVESKLDSSLLQSSYARKLGMSSYEYTEAVDSGAYTNFVHDSAGYGLAQWTYWSRKEALLNAARKCGCSVGDLSMQLSFLWTEIQKYTTVVNTLKSATSVREASDIVAVKYEKPADISEKALQNRATFGQKYYDMFVKRNYKQVVVTSNSVNIRCGNSKDYSKYGQAQKNDTFRWVATSDNNWHAIEYQNKVAWISGEFSKVE